MANYNMKINLLPIYQIQNF